jgi:glucose-1-phosphate thymidylyltransferase
VALTCFRRFERGRKDVSAPPLQTAVVLAAGHGTRMREPRPDVPLTPAQAAMADVGLKAMIPVGGRPFLDYVLTAMADAGYRQVCMVVSDADRVIREHYTRIAPPTRLGVAFAVQHQARGSADAVATAEAVIGRRPFVVVNSDNYYPAAVLEALRTLAEPGLVAFEPRALVAGGNVSPDRLARYAAVHVGPDGYLQRIVEKPGDVFGGSAPTVLVSMNCWRFSPNIFRACRQIAPSVRGELELADAVRFASDVLGDRFRVVVSRESVLDLSNRADIPAVEARLRQVAVLT